jgi:glycerol kinase
MVENELLLQFQADMLDRPVVRPAVKETTALGAAYAAGLAVDYFRDLDELRSNWAVEQTWKPNMEKKTREEMYRYWQRAVAKSTDWLE